MVDLDIGILNLREPADELALQYLGAATLVNWRQLPEEVRATLLEDAGSKIAGLKPMAGLQERVKSLLRANQQI
jgi:hypothetical protein